MAYPMPLLAPVTTAVGIRDRRNALNILDLSFCGTKKRLERLRKTSKIGKTESTAARTKEHDSIPLKAFLLQKRAKETKYMG
jgi:hypothetical protein